MNRFGSGLILIVLISLVLGSVQYAAAAPLQDGDLIASTNIGKLEVFRPDGTLVQTIETGAPSFQAGMCWNQTLTELRVTNANFGSITLLDSDVSSIIHPWVSGLNTPASCVVNASGNFYVSTFDSTADVILFAPDGTQLDTFDLAALFPISNIDLATDNCTLFYVDTSLTIKRYDVCTDTQLSDFATVPVSPFGFCAGLQIRPNGEVITTCIDVVHRLSSAGALIQSYPVSTFVPPILINPDFPLGVVPLLLDPDGTSFWTAQPDSGQVYRIDIATGNTIINFAIPNNFLPLLPGNIGDLEIFNTQTPPVDNDNDGSPEGEDCDDNDPNNFPGNTESCDGQDNNCNDTSDEGFNVGQACSAGEGECTEVGMFVCTLDGLDTECDAVAGSPNTEVCDGLDNNCDGSIDEDLMCNGLPPSGPVGGDFLPIDSTALLLADTQSFSWLIPVVLSILGIGLFVVSRKSE